MVTRLIFLTLIACGNEFVSFEVRRWTRLDFQAVNVENGLHYVAIMLQAAPETNGLALVVSNEFLASADAEIKQGSWE